MEAFTGDVLGGNLLDPRNILPIDEKIDPSELTAMCGACGQQLRDQDNFCKRCGLLLKPENKWSAKYGNCLKDSENIQKLRDLVSKTLRLTLTDGRIFIGSLLCVDKQKNFILSDCKEYRRIKTANDKEKEEKRNVGLVAIGGQYIKDVKYAYLSEEGKKKRGEHEENEKQRQLKEQEEEEQKLKEELEEEENKNSETLEMATS
eukprot:TRINITY_DN9150_c0_g1_i2.p1 TRINITY_DN9150_c0_g1~~TRINITY_DN9150_c0_g1_i2.p1  ORF type:complete len:204 (+),score=59.13 TRINITY_DN9150_c0_g1_i2:65-676(+)